MIVASVEKTMAGNYSVVNHTIAEAPVNTRRESYSNSPDLVTVAYFAGLHWLIDYFQCFDSASPTASVELQVLRFEFWA